MSDLCYVCEHSPATETHHIFNASMRKKSEEYGATIRVCRECHDYIHNHPKYMLILKKTFQFKIMSEYNLTEEDFRAIFHKSYLGVDYED